MVSRCAPRYTDEARGAGLEGTVVLYVELYPDGRAHDVKVLKGLGTGLDERAVDAVKQWRFSPGIKDGKPIVAPATVEVNFRLDDKTEPCRTGPLQDEANPQRGRA